MMPQKPQKRKPKPRRRINNAVMFTYITAGLQIIFVTWLFIEDAIDAWKTAKAEEENTAKAEEENK